MDNIYEVFKALAEPLGDYAPPIRQYIIDTHDRNGVDRMYTLTAVQPASVSDAAFLQAVFEQFADVTVDGVAEMLDGYSHDELEKLGETDIEEYHKHVRPLYINAAYIPEVRRKYPDKVRNIKRQNDKKP